jgi:hypothetical protein
MEQNNILDTALRISTATSVVNARLFSEIDKYNEPFLHIAFFHNKNTDKIMCIVYVWDSRKCIYENDRLCDYNTYKKMTARNNLMPGTFLSAKDSKELIIGSKLQDNYNKHINDINESKLYVEQLKIDFDKKWPDQFSNKTMPDQFYKERAQLKRDIEFNSE